MMASYLLSNGRLIDTTTATAKELEMLYLLHPKCKPTEPEKPKKGKKEVLGTIEKEGE